MLDLMHFELPPPDHTLNAIVLETMALWPGFNYDGGMNSKSEYLEPQGCTSPAQCNSIPQPVISSSVAVIVPSWYTIYMLRACSLPCQSAGRHKDGVDVPLWQRASAPVAV